MCLDRKNVTVAFLRASLTCVVWVGWSSLTRLPSPPGHAPATLPVPPSDIPKSVPGAALLLARLHVIIYLALFEHARLVVSLSLVHIQILLALFVLSSLLLMLSSSLHRASAGGSVLSAACGRLSVGRSLGRLTPRQLGDEDEIDEDVKAEADRVANGGADRDVVKVRFVCFDCLLVIC